MTLAALVHSVNLRERHWQDDYIDDLVIYALLQPRSSCSTATDVQRSIQGLHLAPVEVYVTEVEESISRLKTSERIVEGVNSSLTLSQSCLVEANKKIREWQELESVVRAEWLGSIHDMYPALLREALDSLWISLIDGFVAPVILVCGAESVRIMGGPSKRGLESTSDIKRVLARALARLPEPLRAVAECTFPVFLDAEGRRRRYLMGLVSLVFNLYSLDLPTAVLEQVSAKRPVDLSLLLDTNLLYSLLGLDNAIFNQAVSDLVAIARKAQEYSQGKVVVRLRCDESTIEEFCTSLESRASRWGNVVPSDTVAEIANESCPLDGVVRAYFRQIEETHEQISMSDFVKVKIQSLRAFLSSRNVEIVASLPSTSFVAQDIDNDISSWNATLVKKDIARPRPVLHHDVVLWHSVRQLRQSYTTKSGSFLEPIYLLTCDNQFIDFDRSKTGPQLASEPNKAICMLPATLFHMLSIFVPRTDDFDRAFLRSLRMPIVGAHDNGVERAAEDIVRTLASWKSVPREVAVATLSDKALLNAASKAKSPEDVAGLVNNSLAEQLEALEISHKQELERIRGETASAIKLRDTSIQELQGSVNCQSTELAALRLEFCTVNTQLTQMKTEAQTSKESAAIRKQRIGQALGRGAWSVLVGAFVYLLLKGNTYVVWLSDLERMLVSAICALTLFWARYTRGPHPNIEGNAAMGALTACAFVLAISLYIHHQNDATRVVAGLAALETVVFTIRAVTWLVKKISARSKHRDDT
jgi:hypothetical protein